MPGSRRSQIPQPDTRLAPPSMLLNRQEPALVVELLVEHAMDRGRLNLWIRERLPDGLPLRLRQLAEQARELAGKARVPVRRPEGVDGEFGLRLRRHSAPRLCSA